MGCNAVAQRMRADPLGEAGGPGCLLDDAGELARADWLDRVLAREQPAARQHRALAPTLEPPCSEQDQQIGREHGVAIPATLAAFDTNEHPLAVDIADLERGDFGDPETRTIGDAQRGTML